MNHLPIKRYLCLSGLLALLLSGCATTQTTSGGAVGVERGQTMLLSSSEVNRSAATAYKTTIDSARSKGVLNRDSRQVERVRHIANRLIPATATFRNDAPSWQWEVNVLTAKEVNAWCMPGGKMAVYSGLIEQLQATDDELAAVMGHEIAHALREHGREKASQAAGVNVAAALGGAVIGAYFGVDTRLGQTAIGAVGDLAFMRPNSREMEQEADRVGIELAARAGYDPAAAITLWEKMSRVGGG
ncbi:MAG TPA: M48 family metallopeptidase, partial [Accumulibacter sp.]|nr:M48 family metallopeptidase [Accumulibacter sp.]